MQYIRELAEYNGNGRAAVTFGKFDGHSLYDIE